MKKSALNSRILQKVLMVILIMFTPLTLYAQKTTDVSGKVIDSMTGEPLIGVNVIIQTLKIYSITDINGKYTLQDVPEGKQNILFQMMGYDKTLSAINVKPGEKNIVNISLSYKTAEEVVVTGRRINNTEAALLSKRKKAPVAQDAISSEQISKSPDSDASDAAKRVTGVTIVDGKTVYIRGLGERYSSVMFAGSTIPSPDPDKRVVPLDIFPVGLLDNLVIIKAYTPDIPGEFAGGIVQINPRDYPDKATFKVSIGSGYHSNTTGKDFLTYDGGKYDWFGIDDGTRELPDGIKDDYVNDIFYTPKRIAQIGREFKNEYTPNTTDGKFPFKVNFSYGDSYNIGKNKTLGLIFSGLFKESSKNKDIHFFRVSDNWNTIKDYHIDKSTYSTNKGLLISSSLNAGTDKLRLTSFYSHQSDDNTSEYFGYNNDRQESTVAGAVSTAKIYKLQFITTGLFFSQINGEHYFEKIFKTILDWTASYSRASRYEPDTRTSQLIDLNSTGSFIVYRSDDVKRFFQEHDDSVYGFSPSLTIPFKQWNGLSSKLNIGGAITYRERDSESRTFLWDNGNSLGSISTTPEPLENLLSPGFIVAPGDEDPTHYFIKEASGENDYYTGKLTIIAGYGQFDMPIIPRLRFVGGLRYEYSDMDVITYNPILKEEKDLSKEPLEEDNIMPGVSVTYSATKNTNLRFAYSKTVARPDFREVTEFKYSPMISSEVLIGNPDLEQCDIHNYDLRVEWFPSASEILALSLFYKDMEKPIELLEVTGTPGSTTLKYQNAESAENMGIEFEVKKTFSFISDLFNLESSNIKNILGDLSFSTNIAFIHSNVDVEDIESAKYTTDDRPLQGQSPYVLNSSLNYNNDNIGLNGTLLYNIYGRRIVKVGTIYGTNPRGDIYEEPVGKLDFVAKQKLFSKGHLKISISNILDPAIEISQKRPKSGTSLEKKFTLESYREGRNYSISYSYNL
ncbi:MAG: TonB-dependent receptor [Spirochaetota bacterium]|nr:TonB-dependent receptor [Spirochaetota bacterium]